MVSQSATKFSRTVYLFPHCKIDVLISIGRISSQNH